MLGQADGAGGGDNAPGGAGERAVGDRQDADGAQHPLAGSENTDGFLFARYVAENQEP